RPSRSCHCEGGSFTKLGPMPASLQNDAVDGAIGDRLGATIGVRRSVLAYRSRRGDKTGGMSSVRQALQSLLANLLADPSVAQGYTLASMAFGGAVEVTLERGGAGFVVWLRPSDDNTGCYRQTSLFK